MKRACLWWFAAVFALASSAACAQLCPEHFDGVAAPALPTGWTTATDGAGVAWVTAASQPDTSPSAAFAPMPATVGSSYLVSPVTSFNSTNAIISFRHAFNTEYARNGGALEVSLEGSSFMDITVVGGVFLAGAYNSNISTAYGSPISARQAWSGNSGGYMTTTVQLPSTAIGHSGQLRWRIASDNSFSRPGWWVDSIVCGKRVPGSSPWRVGAHPYPIPIDSQATTVMDGVLYSFGGSAVGGVTAASYKYDGQQWLQIGDLPVARRWAAAVNDGSHIFILGGQDDNNVIMATMYRYTPQTDTYETMASFATPARGFAAAVQGNSIVKFGGMSIGNAPTDATEVYDIGSNSWSPRAPYPLALAHLAGFARNGYVYGAGGFTAGNAGSGKTYRYDPALDVWDDASIPDLPEPRVAATVIDLPQGALLVGSYVGGGTMPRDLSASALLWDAASNGWRTFPALTAARAHSGGGVLQGQPLLVGGRVGGNERMPDVFLYDRLFADGFGPVN